MASSVTRYQPTSGVTRLPDLFERLFQESWVAPSFFDRASGGAAQPTMNVNLFETQDGYVMHAALPGLTPDNLDIEVMGREVAIKGTIALHSPENGSWIWQGIPTGEFYQRFTLPVEVQGDNVEASYDYGILTLSLPKAEHLRPKSIKVSSVQK